MRNNAKKPAKSQFCPKRQIEKKMASIAVPMINDKNLCLGIALSYLIFTVKVNY